MKKISFLALVAAVIAATALGSCKEKQTFTPAVTSTSADVPGWTLNADKPIEFDWYINFSWARMNWGTSSVTKQITEKTGVNIRFITPVGNEDERLNALIAGGALPDIITLGWYQSQIPMMIDAGLVLPLNELAKEYDPFFFRIADPEKIGWYTQPDGNVYGYPNSSYSPSDMEKLDGKVDSYQNFLVRKDMYEAIGSPDMTTPEGFLNALRAAKNMFPTVDGQPLIPLGFGEFSATGGGNLDTYLLSFLALSRETPDGKYNDPTIGPDLPDYVLWLKTFRQAASEGLIPMDVFVDRRTQIDERAAQGRYFAMLYSSWDMNDAQTARWRVDPNTAYIAVDGPKNSAGDPHTLGGGGISGWTLTMISKNVKDKARAIQFISYLMSEEGQMDTVFGVPEDNPFGLPPSFSFVDGVPTLLPDQVEMKVQDPVRYDAEIGADGANWMLVDAPWRDQFPKTFSPQQEQPLEWSRPYVKSFSVYDRLDLEPGSDLAVALDTIKRRWGQDLPKLILASSDAEFDRIWSDFQAFKISTGYDRVQERQTELMNRNKAALQTK